VRLTKSAEKLAITRAERDRLKVERDLLGREMTQLQAQLLALQVSLVETEAELDDCRSGVRVRRSES